MRQRDRNLFQLLFFHSSRHWSKKYNMACFILLLFMFGNCLAFNMDTSRPIIYSGKGNSLFGFAVLEYEFNGKKSIIVGAPDTSTGSIKHGAVYRYSPVDPTTGGELNFESASEERRRKDEESSNDQVPQEARGGQWLGATLASSSATGSVAACAPRYTYVSVGALNKREPIGTCYLAEEGFESFSEYSPCMKGPWGHHRQGSCQAGMSAALTNDSIIIGAPGSWYWQGQVFNYGTSKTEEPEFRTPEGESSTDDQYLGYSMVTGKFSNNRNEDIIVGAPRGNKLKGNVVVYNDDLTANNAYGNLESDQVGSYFGYSLAVGDFNGDRRDDLAVGAPLYATYTDKNPEKFETGRVYIYYGSQGRSGFQNLNRPVILEGDVEKGRFGWSLANLGDIDKDGIDDIAVGAPYGGSNGSGAVHIFLGTAKNTKAGSEVSQTIEGSSLTLQGSSQLKGFGFALSGGTDLDNNGYPDLLVGAHQSSQAVILKARPVVKMEATIEGLGFINASEKNWPRNRNPKSASDSITLGFKYNGENVPSNLMLSVLPKIDLKKPNNPRVTLYNSNGQPINSSFTMPLRRARLNEEVFDVVVNEGQDFDMLQPIVVEFTYQVKQETDDELQPAIGPKALNVKRKTIHFKKDCYNHTHCYPDLAVKVESDIRSYTLGGEDAFILNVSISNKADDAFDSKLELIIPEGVLYEGYSPKKPITCIFSNNKDDRTGGVVTCELGNPMNRNQEIDLSFELRPQSVTDEINIRVNASSLNPDKYINDNVADTKILIIAESVLQNIASVNPDQLTYQSEATKHPNAFTHEEDVGPDVVFTFGVRNLGPSGVKEVNVRIVWPEMTKTNEYLMYRTFDPKTYGNVKCDLKDYNAPNKDNLQLNQTAHDLFISRERSANVRSADAKLLAGNDYRLRTKRQIDLTQALRDKSKWENPKQDCPSDIDCEVFYCTIYDMDKNDGAEIQIFARLWAETMRNLKVNNRTFTAKIMTKVAKLSNGFEPIKNVYAEREVSVDVYSDNIKASIDSGIPWWIILIAILIGLLLLICFILCLWRCGFFKRKRAPKTATASTYHVTPAATATTGASATNGSSAAYSPYRYDAPNDRYHPGTRSSGDAYL